MVIVEIIMIKITMKMIIFILIINRNLDHAVLNSKIIDEVAITKLMNTRDLVVVTKIVKDEVCYIDLQISKIVRKVSNCKRIRVLFLSIVNV